MFISHRFCSEAGKYTTVLGRFISKMFIVVSLCTQNSQDRNALDENTLIIKNTKRFSNPQLQNCVTDQVVDKSFEKNAGTVPEFLFRLARPSATRNRGEPGRSSIGPA